MIDRLIRYNWRRAILYTVGGYIIIVSTIWCLFGGPDIAPSVGIRLTNGDREEILANLEANIESKRLLIEPGESKIAGYVSRNEDRVLVVILKEDRQKMWSVKLPNLKQGRLIELRFLLHNGSLSRE